MGRMESRSVAKKPPEIEDKSTALARVVGAITVVRSPAEYQALVNVGRDVKSAIKVVDDHHKPMHTKAKEAVKAIKDAWDKYRKPLESLDRQIHVIGEGYLSWERQERERKEAEFLAAERKKQEKAKDRQVKVLEKGGEVEQAAAVRAAPVSVAPTVIEPPKAQGAAARWPWNYRVTNAALVPCQWHCLDEKRLRAYVRSVGDKTDIPGIEVFEEVGMALKPW